MAFDITDLPRISDLAGMAVVLRDYYDIEYLNEEHRMLVDIADALRNVMPKDLSADGQAVYLKYSAFFWNEISERIYTDDAAIQRHRYGVVGMSSWTKETELERYNKELERFKNELTKGDNYGN